MTDLRQDERARKANEMMNEVPLREEIEDIMKESAPGEDGVRIGYIRSACEKVKSRVIEIMQKMLESRANE